MTGKKTLAALAVATVATSLAVVLALSSLMEPFSLKSLDLLFRLRQNPAEADRRIILVEVDQRSLDHFEKDNIPFPWPRSLYNPMIQYMTKGGARAVMFDILFNNISPYGEQTDMEFAQAIREAGNVYLATAFTASGPSPEWLKDIPQNGPEITGAVPPQSLKHGASPPIEAIAQAAKGLGSVAFKPDADGVYRRVAPLIIHNGRAFPALFSAPVFQQWNSAAFADGAITADGTAIPVDEQGRMWINYKGGRDAYRRYPAAEVISSALAPMYGAKPTIPVDAFKDSYVIVGYTAPGLFDLKPTPLSSVSPGMDVHAAALDNLLNGDFLRKAPAVATYLAAFAGSLALAFCVIFTTSVGYAAALCAVAMAGVWAIPVFAFSRGVWMDALPLTASAVFSLIGSAAYKYHTEGKQRRFIQKAFAHYVSPKVVSQIIREPERLKLGGEKREISVFFSDLVGFTTLSERTEASTLVGVLNEYTTLMADTITKHDGTVDKYIGDAVMAFWGAPVDQAGHAGMACAAAIECLQRLEAFREELKRRGLPDINMRIGLNTGVCVVGNMGSRDRFDYTAIGDAVNQASRLEGLNKAYHTRILAAEPTYIAARDKIFGRKIDLLTVKGKEKPTLVYEIITIRGMETEAQRKAAVMYEEAFEKYLARDFAEAKRILENHLSTRTDEPAAALLERVLGYIESPPPPDWDGAFRHTAK